MSKVVTIPKDRNPFIVIVNGVEYKYPAGATIEVPDSVADVIEKYEGAKPKPDPTPTPGGGTGGSVQTDWNQNDSSAADFLKNKPFGDELVEIMPETEMVGQNADGMYIALLDPALFPARNATYAVTFDGVEYTRYFMFDFNTGVFMCGNSALFGGADTGEPFLLLASPDSDAALVLTDENPHTVSIKELVIQELDRKYYSGCTIFYPDGIYLYTDFLCTIKATRGDVINAIKNGGVVLNTVDSLLTTPCNINCVTYDYAVMVCMEWRGGSETETTLLYTAEYTES